MFQKITLFGTEITLYHFFFTVGLILLFVMAYVHLSEFKQISTFCALRERTTKSNNKDTFMYKTGYPVLEVTLVILVSTLIAFPLDKPLSIIFLGDRSGNFFRIIYFLPFVFFINGIIFRISPLKLWDYCAMLPSFALPFFKTGCFFGGCCYGIEMASSPFFNHRTNRYELPIQLIEVAVAILIYLILFQIRKRKKKVGVLFPAFILLYSGTRFVTEFWRNDYPARIWKLNGYHLQCLIGLVLGAVFLFGVLKWGEQMTAYFDRKNEAFIEKQIEKRYMKRLQRARKKQR